MVCGVGGWLGGGGGRERYFAFSFEVRAGALGRFASGISVEITRPVCWVVTLIGFVCCDFGMCMMLALAFETSDLVF